MKIDMAYILVYQKISQEIHQKELTIINLYAPNVNIPNFSKHTLKDSKAHIDANTVVVGDFNTSPITNR
jgi:hypothetical protein